MNIQECVDPEATIEICLVCKNDVRTCERTVAVNGDYRCPVHPGGLQSNDGFWFCGTKCYDDHFKTNDQN